MGNGETPQEMPSRETLDLLDQEKAEKQQLSIFSNSVLGDFAFIFVRCRGLSIVCCSRISPTVFLFGASCCHEKQTGSESGFNKTYSADLRGEVQDCAHQVPIDSGSDSGSPRNEAKAK
jgi:hypothetical protein